MSVIASLVGSGAGIVIIGVAFAAMAHLQHLPQMVHPWMRRLLIVAMYAGGSALAVTELGTLARSAVNWVAGFFGGLGAGGPRAAVIITCVLLLLATAVALIWVPNEGTALLAAALPFLLSLVAGGFIHQVYVGTTFPAQHLADAFSAWLGG